MNRFGRFGRFGDAPPGMAPPPVLMPSSVPNTLPQTQSEDFFDPNRDGSDIMFYTTNFSAALANGVSTTSQIQIDSGVDFYWFASTYQSDLTGVAQLEGTTIVPLVTVLINDTGSRKNLMNGPIPVAELAGPGERPYRLVRPRLFRSSSTINFTWANYSAATTYTNIYLTLHGYTKPRNT
jgi:hypothetical protein